MAVGALLVTHLPGTILGHSGSGGSAQAALAARSRPRALRDPLIHHRGVTLGVNLDTGSSVAGLRSFVGETGIRPKVVMWYQTWDQAMAQHWQLAALASRRAIPMITWMPMRRGVGIPLSQIAAGRFDSYIRSAARVAAHWHHILYIRFAHEMNLGSSLWGPGREGNTPAIFVAAWRHVVSLFRKAGAVNAEFVWSPNVNCQGHCPFTAFYPGNKWVDWVALDGYNYAQVEGDRWMTFKQIFGPSYARITRLSSRPVMIGETASTELGGSKPQWILGIASALEHFTRIKALVWFDRIKETDWRIDSSPASLQAFRQLLASPAFTR